MATASDLIAWHRRHEGQRDNGGSFIWGPLIERGFFPRYYNGYAYCGATQMLAALETGIGLAPFKPAEWIYCPSIVRRAKALGLWRNSRASQTGDLALMRWDGVMTTDEADHVVMVLENDPSKPYITVIGGNHRDGKTNGPRGMFVRTWPRSVVLGTVNRQAAYSKAPAPKPVTKPATSTTSKPVTKPATSTTSKPVTKPAGTKKPVTLKVGSKGAEVRSLQAGLNKQLPLYSKLTIDGVFGPATATVVKEFQRRSKLTIDGIVGPLTRAALVKAKVL